VWTDLDAVARTWTRADRFEPRMNADQRRQLIDGWRRAVAKTLTDAA
jgi:glycerol kinase